MKNGLPHNDCGESMLVHWFISSLAYIKRKQNVKRGRGNPAPTIAVARFLNMSLFLFVRVEILYDGASVFTMSVVGGQW